MQELGFYICVWVCLLIINPHMYGAADTVKTEKYHACLLSSTKRINNNVVGRRQRIDMHIQELTLLMSVPHLKPQQKIQSQKCTNIYKNSISLCFSTNLIALYGFCKQQNQVEPLEREGIIVKYQQFLSDTYSWRDVNKTSDKTYENGVKCRCILLQCSVPLSTFYIRQGI